MMENPILQGLHLTSACRGQIVGIRVGKIHLCTHRHIDLCAYIYIECGS